MWQPFLKAMSMPGLVNPPVPERENGMATLKRSFQFSDKRRALLKARLHSEGVSPGSELGIEPVDRAGPHPLSYAQQRMWILNQLEPGSPAYNFPAGIRLRGVLDISVLERCLNEIVRRHATLRTTFSEVNGLPVQCVSAELKVLLPLIDLRAKSPAEQTHALQELVGVDVLHPFDLGRGPLLRLKLARLADDEHLLIVTFHHIVSDGWAFSLFLNELGALYEAFSLGKPPELPDLKVHYTDFARWQRDPRRSEAIDSQLAYWKENLAGAPAVLDLPADRPRPAVPTHRGARYFFALSKPLSDGLQELSRREGATLFMTLLAGLNVLLHRYTGRTDIVVGSPVAARNRSEIEGLLGFFLNMLVLRTDLSGSPGFKEVLGRVRAAALGAYAHQDVPFERLVEELHLKRELSIPPLFQVMFVLQSRVPEPLRASGLTMTAENLDRPAATCDLTVHLAETPGGLEGFIEYSTELFDERTIAQFARHLRALLGAIMADPESEIDGLSYLSNEEVRRTLYEWNATQVEEPLHRTIPDLFETQVERTPDAIAVIHGNRVLSYCGLNARANQLARYLQRLGVGPEVLVGICLPRSIDMVVGILAALKAGGAYVPLDPAYPKERLGFVLKDANARVLLTAHKYLPEFSNQGQYVLCLESIGEALDQECASNPGGAATPENLAYVIYTSGSTGRPKGVAIEHRRTAAFMDWGRKTFSSQELAGVLFSTSICFDLSVFELFVPLSCGGKVIVASDALELKDIAAKQRVTLLNTVPSAMRELLRNEAVPDTVAVVNLAGEVLTGKLVEAIYASTAVKRVYNLYGPTEDTTYSSGAIIGREERGEPHIGRPLSNKMLYILDRKLQPVPAGVTGDLYIGGSGLARGYLRRPDLSAERFIPNPFSNVPGDRMYGTGDLARHLPDGNIAYVGRADQQVKIRGYRIELGEIESVASRHPSASAAVVVVRSNKDGVQDLVLYVGRKDQGICTRGKVRQFLIERLPGYMIPSTIVVLDALPLTPNGKIDRRALPDPDEEPGAPGEFTGPRTDIERELASIWSNLLNRKQIGMHDNFFEIGGHSLLATQMISRIRHAFHLEIPIRALFESPTISELAAVMDAQAPHGMPGGEMDAILSEIESITDSEAAAMLHKGGSV